MTAWASPTTGASLRFGGSATTDALGHTWSFTHDGAGARTGVTLPNGAFTASGYDPAGRIESIVTTAALNLVGASVDGSATASFAIDAADRITIPGFTYDDAGNLTCDGQRLFTYDAACRLVAVTDASTETTIATYAYDAMNRRTSSTEGTATVFFHYDGASARVIAEMDATGATIASYTHDSGGALFSMTRDGATYFYHLNARGDVVALSDSTGAVVNTYAYDPWGQLLSESETVSNPYRYASYRYDSATGLSYCWNRYYAPDLARFLTRDVYPGELADPVTMNPYLYCGGDPVNAVDPSGMAHVAGGLGSYWRVDSVYPAHDGMSLTGEGLWGYVGIDNGRVIERSRMTPSYYRDPLSGERCSTLSANLGVQAGWETGRAFTVQESLTGIGIGVNPWSGVYLWRGMGHVSSGWQGPSGYAVDGLGYEVGTGGGTQEIFGTPNAGVNFFNYLW